MKNIKCKNYSQVLKAEYMRMKKNPIQAGKLRDMGELLDKIANLPSPQKEHAFVEGVLALAHLPSIAA